jgi:hypothetical protein
MQVEQYNMLKLQEQRAQQQFEMQRDALKEWQSGGQPPQAQPAGIPPAGIPQSAPPGSPMKPASLGPTPQVQMGGGDAELRRIGSLAIAGLPGAKEILDIYKYKNTPVNAPANSWSINPVSGQRTYNADAAKGLTVGNNGIERLHGSENIAGLAGDAAAATEAAKANLDLVDIPMSDGTSKKMSRADAVKMLSQGNSMPSVGTRQPTAQEQALIAQDAQKNGIQNPFINLSQKSAVAGQTQSPTDAGQVKNVIDAGGKINDTWLKTTYEPTIVNGQAAQSIIDNTGIARTAMRSMGGTGWGTDAKAAGANILAGLGVASNNVEAYASNAQLFQKASSERLWSVLNNAKGPQTEGDAARAKQTYGQLANTPQANEFIFDLAQANAERDKAKASFFDNALPIARQSGDLSEVSREWSKRMPSIFDMPSMKRWKK